MSKFILVTGGAGYIGSHTCAALVEAGWSPVIMDNFCNSSESVLERLKTITGCDIPCIRADVRDGAALERVFSQFDIAAVIHFAGLKAVGDSTSQPLRYYQNNVGSSMALLCAMEKRGVTRLIFSSSATVYAESEQMPLHEDAPLSCSNPYGWTKLISERIITDACSANDALSAVLLRYFNPIGAHESGLIGDDPDGIPNNLMPYITRVAGGELPELTVFGNDYPTIDGTGVRDYIHVLDLARAHVLAVDYALSHTGAEAINIGRGEGCSVMQVIAAFERATGVKIPCRIAARRPGDIARYYAATDKAGELLGFTAKKDIEDMCRDAWRYEQNRVNGRI